MSITVQHVIDTLMEPVPPLKHTVDSLLTGEHDAIVKGIATSFLATHSVIQQAGNLGVNLLISHEGIFYSHRDTSIKVNDPVYANKLKLIEETNMAIFRFHDSIHLSKPDGITIGLIERLHWESYVEHHHPAVSFLSLPNQTVAEIAQHIKRMLHIPFVRVVGDLSMECKRAAVSVGFRGGGENAIPLFHHEQIDVLITGEGPEWETPEYVRDANQQGRKKALIIIGHAESEKAGMERVSLKLRSIYPNLPVYFIDEKPVFQFV